MEYEYGYTGLIIGGIVVILIVRMIIGFWASKKVQNNVDYVLAGRRLPLWMAAHPLWQPGLLQKH